MGTGLMAARLKRLGTSTRMHRTAVDKTPLDPPRPRRFTGLAGGSLAVAVVVLFGLWPLSGGDLPEHLVVGQWIWHHQAIPRVDVFTYVTAGGHSSRTVGSPKWCSTSSSGTPARSA
jgi:hypothetical protein